jgi:hypothetical protein
MIEHHGGLFKNTNRAAWYLKDTKKNKPANDRLCPRIELDRISPSIRLTGRYPKQIRLSLCRACTLSCRSAQSRRRLAEFVHDLLPVAGWHNHELPLRVRGFLLLELSSADTGHLEKKNALSEASQTI